MTPTWALARNEMRTLRREADAIVLLILLPLLITPALRETITAAIAPDHPGVDGANFAVPGQAVLFGFFITAFIGFSFFREHGWHTWERLLASRAKMSEIAWGKSLPWFSLSLIQTGVLFGVGVLAYDLELGAETIVGVTLVSLAYAVFLTTFSLLLVAVLPSIVHVQAVANLGALTLGTAGGALVPSDSLPGWLRAVGPVTPTHWVMEAHTSLLLDGDGWEAAAIPTAVVMVMATAAGVLAIWRFDARRAKSFHL